MATGNSQSLIVEVPLESDLGRLGMALRVAVFVDEQHMSPEEELDAHDPGATHIVALLDGNVAGVMRIVYLPEHAKLGRVAVAARSRGKGVATAMMNFAMEQARAQGKTRFYLTAQVDKVPLYEKLGFTAFGDVFDDGGMPHLAMKTY